MAMFLATTLGPGMYFKMKAAQLGLSEDEALSLQQPGALTEARMEWVRQKMYLAARNLENVFDPAGENAPPSMLQH